ncbi:MAG: serine/threonine protein kinase [Puniceicoccaceae bacterium]|nr:MAG: serine/threonine protein kinase [Puniceicoccaceae bacterium]
MIMDISGMGFTDELSSLQPGMSLGNLHIVSFIGKGAIGEVYLAQHEILGKEFAVKVIPKGFIGEDGDDVFKQAARVQAKLVHPNILSVDDLGEEDMFYWLRMEYMAGEDAGGSLRLRSLEDLMRRNEGPLTVEEVNYYLYHLLLGLDHAHKAEVIHADLKPANIMLADEGVKITELGVTDLIGHAWDDFHLLRDNPRLEPTMFEPLPGFSRALPSLLNTFEYFSPEQRAGQAPDHISNLFTVGLITYRMLTGRQNLSLEWPSAIVDGLDPDWDVWLQRALAYEPEYRFQSAVEMLHAVPGLASDQDKTAETQHAAQ